MVNPALTQIASNTTLAITELQGVAVTVAVSVTPVAGDMVIWTGSPPVLGDLPSVATGSVLLSAGVATAPTWGQVNTATIATSAVTYAKLQNEATVTLLGNPTGAPAAPSEITLGTNLAFAGTVLNAATPGLTYLGTVPVSGGAISDTTILAANNSTYRSFQLILKNLIPSNNAVSVQLRVHEGGTFPSTSYLSMATSTRSGAGTQTTASTADIRLTGYPITNTAAGMGGFLFTSDLANTGNRKNWTGQTVYLDSGTSTITVTGVSGYWDGGNNAIDGFELLTSAGNWTSGNIDIYGML